MRTIGFGVLSLVLVACGDSFTATKEPPVTGGDAGAGLVDAQPPPNCDATKLPTEDACVITEAFGVFVSSTFGNDANADGSRSKPFATLSKGIAAAKQANRNVYACAEKYPENVEFADGVSVFGYFWCT